MTTGKAVALGCGIAGFVGLLVMVVVGFFIWHVTQDVEGVTVNVDAPANAVVGAEIALLVSVTNERTGDALDVSTIDVADEYLEGFTVSSVEPKAKSSAHIPIDNSRSFTFDTTVPPGKTRDFIFTLKAQRAGIFRGDVDVCEGARFVTSLAETVVSVAP